jgi:hypothetical protein
MKKRKINLKKLSLQKRTIAAMNANSVQGGTGTLLETQVFVICHTLINTTIVSATNTVVEVTKTCIDLPPMISKDYKSCISDCMC